MVLLMIRYHTEPIATGSVIKRCIFNYTGQKGKGKLH